MFLPRLNHLWRSLQTTSANGNFELEVSGSSEDADAVLDANAIVDSFSVKDGVGGPYSLKEETSNKVESTLSTASTLPVHPASVPVRSLHKRCFI